MHSACMAWWEPGVAAGWQSAAWLPVFSDFLQAGILLREEEDTSFP